MSNAWLNNANENKVVHNLSYEHSKEDESPDKLNSLREKQVKKKKDIDNKVNWNDIKKFPNDIIISIEKNDNKINQNNDEIDRQSNPSSMSSLKIKVKPMKKNGFSRPFHPLQISAWVVFGINILTYYLIITPCFIAKEQITATILSILYLILSGFIVFYAISAMKVNPTDRTVLLNRELLK